MKVYMLRANSDRYQSLLMTVGNLAEFANRFNGRPMKRSCKDVEIVFDPRRVPRGDFPSLTPSAPIFSQRAVSTLRDVLEDYGELLPIIAGGEEYFLFNATRIVDALDESNSEIIRFEGTTRVMYIDTYVFFKKKISGLLMFKIPQMIDDSPFVTDAFVKRVRSARLKGFWFPLVWSSE